MYDMSCLGEGEGKGFLLLSYRLCGQCLVKGGTYVVSNYDDPKCGQKAYLGRYEKLPIQLFIYFSQ